MSTGPAVFLALLVFAAMIGANVPVAIGLAAAGATGLLLTEGLSLTEPTLGSAPWEGVAGYALVVIPMFVLMGVLIANAGVLRDVFDVASRVTRRVPGGLGVATVMAAAGFAAVTGSSAAAVATLGRLCVGEMRKYGYHVRLAAGIVAASGTLGILIPPSIVLVIYGVLTTESIGQLLLAAIIPGIITATVYATTIICLVKFGNQVDDKYIHYPDDEGPRGRPAMAGGSGVVEDEEEQVVTAGATTAVLGRSRGRLQEIESVFYIFLLFAVVIGGIYGGYFTETEAGAMGAAVALLVLLVRGPRTDFGLVRSLVAALRETAAVTSMIFALLIGGAVFTTFLVTARVPNDLTDWVVGLEVSGLVVVIIFLVILLVLGALLDGVSIMLLTIPLAYPVITELGYSGIWFGIITVKMIEIGLLTPPFGLNVYLVSGVVKGVRVEDAFRGAAPFVIAELLVVALLVAFPEICTWLPDLASENR